MLFLAQCIATLIEKGNEVGERSFTLPLFGQLSQKLSRVGVNFIFENESDFESETIPAFKI